MIIVVLAYNKCSFFQECLSSLFDQRIKVKIIVSTSTPIEKILNIAEKFDILVSINHNSGGIASDWNFALNHCGNKYATLAHQDDVYLSNYISEVSSCIKKHPRALIYFSDYAEIINNQVIRWNLRLIVKRILLMPFYFKRSIKCKFIKKLILSFGSPICCPSVTYNKEQLGNFEFSPDFHINLDWDAWWKLANRKGAFVYIPKVLVYHRIHNEAETSKAKRDNRRFIEDEKMFKKIWGTSLFSSFLLKIYKISY
ncbi:MAG: glycosyltransferase [Candidatus Cloacimonetes bacterium]|nr:glycosyltransferase [Candidatus Cloacimonadota bacterium]